MSPYLVLENLWNRKITLLRSLAGSAALFDCSSKPVVLWDVGLAFPSPGRGEIVATNQLVRSRGSPGPASMCSLARPLPVPSSSSESSWLCLPPGSKPCV